MNKNTLLEQASLEDSMAEWLMEDFGRGVRTAADAALNCTNRAAALRGLAEEAGDDK